MTSKRNASLALALLLFAQANLAAAQGAQPPTASQDAAATSSNTFVAERRQDQWLASGLRSKNVYDRNDHKIGAINDLVIDRDGRIAAIVIGVGGFLGIGEKNVAVPFQDVKISMRDNNEWLVLDRSKDDLRAAPPFGVASGPSQDVSGGSERSYGTLNAPHRNEEAQSR